MKKRTIPTRVDAHDYEWLAYSAERQGLKLGEVVRQAVSEYVDRVKTRAQTPPHVLAQQSYDRISKALEGTGSTQVAVALPIAADATAAEVAEAVRQFMLGADKHFGVGGGRA